MGGPSAPLRQFVLKVSSRCDLACDHCYVYEHADQTWRTRPSRMSVETVAWSVSRIAEHVKRRNLGFVSVVLHGGEPLLVGVAELRRIIVELRQRLDELCDVDLRVHTNGVLLDEKFLDLFEEMKVKVGVSLDGDRVANDRHRRYASGRSSYDRVIRGIGLLRERPSLYAGLLCTVDIANDPLTVYRALVDLEPPRIDFLLPHATWEAPPARSSATAYADWLIQIFDVWLAEGSRVAIRMFESVVGTSWGGASGTESLGLEPSDLVVIETDGAYEQADSLKVAFDGAPSTGLSVFEHDLAAVAAHSGILARQDGLAGLCDTCRACPVVDSCGGGLYAHRYRAGSGFANPSVYCSDLLKLITHIRRAVARRTHTLPSATFDALAAGRGDERDMERLLASQRTFRRALLGEVQRRWPDAEAWDLLTRLDHEHRPAVNEILDHPYVRRWAVSCLTGSGDPRYVANVAAAAAIKAGVRAGIALANVDGVFHLPTLGSFDAGKAVTAGLLVRDGEFELDAPGETTWWPTRRLEIAGGPTITLEDTDPYRHCHGHAPTGRLTEDEVAVWRTELDEAWALISSRFPGHVAGLRAAFRTVVPLAPLAGGHDASSAARDAFGAVAAALPKDPATLALLLLHEFQHVKLGAVLDMVALHDPEHARLYYAPWRPDPRPLEGLLQGTYAHLVVTEFWGVRRHEDPEHGEVQFALWREQTARALDSLGGSKALTPLGGRFVALMRDTLRPWLAEPVSERARSAAAGLAERHQAAALARRL